MEENELSGRLEALGDALSAVIADDAASLQEQVAVLLPEDYEIDGYINGTILIGDGEQQWSIGDDNDVSEFIKMLEADILTSEEV